MSRLTRDGTVEPVSREQIPRRERGQENVHFSCSAHHEQDWQPYPVDPYSVVNAIGTQLRGPIKLGTDPMAYGGFINGRRRGTREESRK